MLINRAKVLQAYPGAGFSNVDSMSETYYLLDPARFWVNAYRHYLRADAGPAFVHAIIQGKMLMVRP